MDQLILLFLQRGKEKQHDSLLPYLSLSSIITYTYTRKRIKKAGSILEQYLHSGVRYINDGDYKGQYKNAYQGVATRMTGGNRP